MQVSGDRRDRFVRHRMVLPFGSENLNVYRPHMRPIFVAKEAAGRHGVLYASSVAVMLNTCKCRNSTERRSQNLYIKQIKNIIVK